jgi:hypothetical protein
VGRRGDLGDARASESGSAISAPLRNRSGGQRPRIAVSEEFGPSSMARGTVTPEGYTNRDTGSEQRASGSITGSAPASLRRPPMLLSLVYLVLRRLLRALAPSDRSDLEREIELLVLRHQVQVLSRGVRRPPFRPGDRMLLAAASRILPRHRWRAFIVAPRTLLRWHRDLVRRKWTYHRRGPGRPGLDQETVELIVRMARENPRWGYLRIRGELMKLGIRVSATAIRTVLRREGLGPAPRRGGPSWSEFLRARPAASWRSTSSLSRQSGSAPCTSCSASSSGPAGCTSSESPGTRTRRG